MDPNTIANGMYNSAVLSGLVIANCMIAKKVFKTTPPNISEFDIKDGVKLTLNVFTAMMINQWLTNQGILPPKILPIEK